jgi:hypothetical protein
MECQLRLLSSDEAKVYSSTNSWLDHTRCTAIHTCPRWGVVRYMHGKSLEVSGREMPLEAGSAMHQAFAAHRLWQLWRTVAATLITDDDCHKARLILESGIRIFGADRWTELEKKIWEPEPQPIALEALYTSGYYDSPTDKRRTLSNMEKSLLMYLNRYDSDYLPFVEDDFVGIEVPVRIGLRFEDGTDFMYTGRVDAVLAEPRSGAPILAENKTASNVANQWEVQWRTSHQPTGYMAGLGLQLNRRIDTGKLFGLQVPLPATSDYKGYVETNLHRTTRAFGEWLKWVHAAWMLWQEYAEQPFQAPMYTHSCYRYFRPCSFVPICDIGEDDPPVTLTEMVDDRWHPEET